MAPDQAKYLQECHDQQGGGVWPQEAVVRVAKHLSLTAERVSSWVMSHGVSTTERIVEEHVRIMEEEARTDEACLRHLRRLASKRHRNEPVLQELVRCAYAASDSSTNNDTGDNASVSEADVRHHVRACLRRHIGRVRMRVRRRQRQSSAAADHDDDVAPRSCRAKHCKRQVGDVRFLHCSRCRAQRRGRHKRYREKQRAHRVQATAAVRGMIGPTPAPLAVLMKQCQDRNVTTMKQAAGLARQSNLGSAPEARVALVCVEAMRRTEMGGSARPITRRARRL